LLYSGIIGYDILYVTYLDNGIGIYNGLFHSTAITYSFDLFIYIIVPIILLLTAFYARRIAQLLIPYNRFEPQDGLFSAEGLSCAITYILVFIVIGLCGGLFYLLCLEDFSAHGISIVSLAIFPAKPDNSLPSNSGDFSVEIRVKSETMVKLNPATYRGRPVLGTNFITRFSDASRSRNKSYLHKPSPEGGKSFSGLRNKLTISSRFWSVYKTS
jgi:hypothetical protein